MKSHTIQQLIPRMQSILLAVATQKNTIAEFKDNAWRQLDDLNLGRQGHGSISFGVQTIVIGGNTSGGE